MSKYLQSASDKEALSAVVQKVTGNVMNKGWNCLFQYAKEMNETKKTVRTFAMRLMKVEHSRGWNKARLVYKQRKQTLKLRQDQQEYAAKFLASRMQNMQKQAARPLTAVRTNMMTTIQKKFRHYRSEKIFDRIYALGNDSNSRIHQLKKGLVMDCAFQSCSCEDILQMSLSGGGDKALRSELAYLKTKKASYTENNVGLHRAQVAASDSLAFFPAVVTSFAGVFPVQLAVDSSHQRQAHEQRQRQRTAARRRSSHHALAPVAHAILPVRQRVPACALS
jgi:hypothetical protein